MPTADMEPPKRRTRPRRPWRMKGKPMAFDYAAKFEQALPYQAFLERYGTPEHRRRWEALHAQVKLTAAHRELLAGFRREMKVICLAGAWCGDCVNQCPIFDHFAAAAPT